MRNLTASHRIASYHSSSSRGSRYRPFGACRTERKAALHTANPNRPQDAYRNAIPRTHVLCRRREGDLLRGDACTVIATWELASESECTAGAGWSLIGRERPNSSTSSSRLRFVPGPPSLATTYMRGVSAQPARAQTDAINLSQWKEPTAAGGGEGGREGQREGRGIGGRCAQRGGSGSGQVKSGVHYIGAPQC
jgi:hypothetical protein